MEVDLEKDHEFREYFTPEPDDLVVKEDEDETNMPEMPM